MARTKDIWLSAFTDPLACATAFTPNICMADLNGDGDYALLIADEKKNFRIWRGTSVKAQLQLVGVPSAAFQVYVENETPPQPWVGVLCDNAVFFYKSIGGVMKPRARFELPDLEVKEGSDAGKKIKQIPTCMTTLHVLTQTETEPSHIVIGTESKELFILSPGVAKVLSVFTLPQVPTMIACEGEFSVEYRIAISFRNGSIGVIRDQKLVPSVITTGTGIVGVGILNKRIYVARTDKLYECYNLKGKCFFSLQLPAHCIAFEVMQMSQTRQFKGIILALDNGDVI
ncbi:MAG: hypothetical protein EZS28_045767, partial [Streblomastix strix]